MGESSERRVDAVAAGAGLRGDRRAGRLDRVRPGGGGGGAGGDPADAGASGGVVRSGAVAYTRMCRLAGVELDAAERGPAWALERAASSAGRRRRRALEPSGVTSARRMAAGAVLREVEDFDDVTMIAVVDAAARWLEEPDGDEYAYALLGAVTDGADAAAGVRRAARVRRWPMNGEPKWPRAGRSERRHRIRTAEARHEGVFCTSRAGVELRRSHPVRRFIAMIGQRGRRIVWTGAAALTAGLMVSRVRRPRLPAPTYDSATMRLRHPAM